MKAKVLECEIREQGEERPTALGRNPILCKYVVGYYWFCKKPFTVSITLEGGQKMVLSRADFLGFHFEDTNEGVYLMESTTQKFASYLF